MRTSASLACTCICCRTGDLNPVTLEPFAPRSLPQAVQSAAPEPVQQGPHRPWHFQRRTSGGKGSGDTHSLLALWLRPVLIFALIGPL